MEKDIFVEENFFKGPRKGCPLSVNYFMEDLKDIFAQHGVKSIEKGYIGFEGSAFTLRGADIDINGNRAPTTKGIIVGCHKGCDFLLLDIVEHSNSHKYVIRCSNCNNTRDIEEDTFNKMVVHGLIRRD